MKKTSKLLILFFLGLFAQGVYAQVKVGNNPTTINSNSVLELEATNKGLLLPRVTLSATNNASPLSAHVAGMIVYNTATAGTLPNDVVPGYYYNDGTKWQLIAFSDLADVDNDGGPVIDNTLTAPPTSGDDGDVYIVPSGASGDWAGQTNNIAELAGVNTSGNLIWNFYTPVSGEKRVVTEGANAGNTYQFNGTTWVLSSTRPPTSPFWRLGGNYTNTRNNRVGTINNNSFRLMSRGRDRLIVHPNGNVSIGRTTAPSRLSVSGGALIVSGAPNNNQGMHLSWNSGILFGGLAAQGYSGFVNHRGTGAGGFTWAQTNDASTYIQLMRLNPNGLLIGGGLQDFPSQRLEVNGNIALSSTYNMGIMRNTVGLIRIGSNMPSLLGVSQPTFQGSFISFDSRSTKPAIEFHVKQPNSSVETEAMVINNSGNVGIGTVSPTERLQVSGGNIRIDNSASYIVSGAGGVGPAINSNTIIAIRSLTGIAFETDSEERMRINIAGNIGIGTTSPTRKLDVFGDISNRGLYFINSADGNSAGAITTTGQTGTDNGIVITSTRAAGKIVFETNNGGTSERMRINNNGNVGIGTASPSQRLTVFNGTTTGTYTTTGWLHSSDARLKTNVVKVENALGLVNQLNGVYYNWSNNLESGRQLGFLAQDVQKVVPEVVMGVEGDVTKGETLSMAYQNLVPVLVEAIKDQQKQIDELKAKLELLEKK